MPPNITSGCHLRGDTVVAFFSIFTCVIFHFLCWICINVKMGEIPNISRIKVLPSPHRLWILWAFCASSESFLKGKQDFSKKLSIYHPVEILQESGGVPRSLKEWGSSLGWILSPSTLYSLEEEKNRVRWWIPSLNKKGKATTSY